MLEPIIVRYRGRLIKLFFRGDAGFASPGLYDVLEDEGYLYAIRLKSNPVLNRHIEYLCEFTRASTRNRQLNLKIQENVFPVALLRPNIRKNKARLLITTLKKGETEV